MDNVAFDLDKKVTTLQVYRASDGTEFTFSRIDVDCNGKLLAFTMDEHRFTNGSGTKLVNPAIAPIAIPVVNSVFYDLATDEGRVGWRNYVEGLEVVNR